MKRPPVSTQASALLMVFWALLLLGGAVFSWVTWIQQDITLHGEANRALEARAMAHSGVTIALHPAVTKQSPGLAERVGPNLGFGVRLESEGGKLNLNWLLAGEDQRRLTILRLWLQAHRLTPEQCDRFVDGLLDYVDADDVKRLNGAERDPNYRPRNAPLQSVEELAAVRGTGPLVAQPGWQEDLTIYSQGPIDLTSASRAVLRLIPGLSEARITALLTFRAGKDGREGTADDGQITDLAGLQALLKMSAEEFKTLRMFISINDPTWRVRSTGYSATVSRQVEVVARKAGGGAQILAWKE